MRSPLKFRDLLALPLMIIALAFIGLAGFIGSAWTSQQVLEMFKNSNLK